MSTDSCQQVDGICQVVIYTLLLISHGKNEIFIYNPFCIVKVIKFEKKCPIFRNGTFEQESSILRRRKKYFFVGQVIFAARWIFAWIINHRHYTN